jgi:hypothetical protein
MEQRAWCCRLRSCACLVPAGSTGCVLQLLSPRCGLGGADTSCVLGVNDAILTRCRAAPPTCARGGGAFAVPSCALPVREAWRDMEAQLHPAAGAWGGYWQARRPHLVCPGGVCAMRLRLPGREEG